MTLELCIVGAGECFENYYLPANAALSKEGVSAITTVIDIRSQSELKIPPNATFIQRQRPDQPLSELLVRREPNLVVLSHPNSFHLPDAEELVDKGYKVLLEKPFALNIPEISRVDALLKTGNLGLVEYYLFGKTIPLHIFSGAVQSAIYTSIPGLLTGDVEALRWNEGRLKQVIGEILSIQTEVLEGEGRTGSILHRNDDLSVARNGGGMLQDIGIHALTPVTALKHLIGELRYIRPPFGVAVCEEHLEHFTAKGYSPKEVAETYASVGMDIGGRIPLSLVVGKYVLGGPEHGRNQRRLLILGTKGRIDVDMSKCEMAVYEGESLEPRWKVGVNRVDFPRYYIVLRTAFAEMEADSQRTLTNAAIDGQFHTLKMVDTARVVYGQMPTYKWGAEVHEINRSIEDQFLARRRLV